MNQIQYEKALNVLKSVNNFTPKSTTHHKSKNRVTVQYKHQIVELGDYSLVLSGTLEQFYSKDHSTDRMFLVISLLDDENQDLTLTPNQLEEVKIILKDKIYAI